MGAVLGNAYGEVTELCPPEDAGDAAHPFCVYRDGLRQGADPAVLLLPGAGEYIERGFPLMWARRMRTATVGVGSGEDIS